MTTDPPGPGTPVLHMGVAPYRGMLPIGTIASTGAMCYAWDSPYPDGSGWYPEYTIKPPEAGMVGVCWADCPGWEYASDQTWEYPTDLKRIAHFDLDTILILAHQVATGCHKTDLKLRRGDTAHSATSTKWHFLGPGEVTYLIHPTDIVVTASRSIARRYK